MFSFSSLRASIVAFAICAGAFATSGTAARACDVDSYQPRYRWVVCYEPREVPKAVCVTYYDCYGNAYEVTKTVYVSVTVPVRHLVQIGG